MFYSNAASGPYCNFSWSGYFYNSTCNSGNNSTAILTQMTNFDTIQVSDNFTSLLTLTTTNSSKFGFPTTQINAMFVGLKFQQYVFNLQLFM